jgi:glycosyltransferase involved in cell wall biosynthesis
VERALDSSMPTLACFEDPLNVTLPQEERRKIPSDFVLSVVLPVYNERETIRAILEKVRAVPFSTEIIVVDDGSSDGSREILRKIEEEGRLIDRLIFHDGNRGKGGALRTGFEAVTGDVVIVQDADLEYDPSDYSNLVRPIVDGKADVVFGSRFLTTMAHRVLYFWHAVANRLLTLFSDMLTNLNLTDMETCYKVFRTEVVRSLDLQERGFGVEPEITAKVASLGCRVYEVGISYAGRSYEEGKKIGWKDAIWALFCIARYRFFGRPRRIDWSWTPPRRRSAAPIPVPSRRQEHEHASVAEREVEYELA